MKLGRLTTKNIEHKLKKIHKAQAYQIVKKPLFLQIFVDEHENGVSKKSLAKKFGISVAAVITLLEMLGYTKIFMGFIWPLLQSSFNLA